jgi:hypothetical protein
MAIREIPSILHPVLALFAEGVSWASRPPTTSQMRDSAYMRNTP